MITELSSRQLIQILSLGFAVIFNLFCAAIVLKRDPHYHGNRFTSFAYTSLAFAMGFNVYYVLQNDDLVISFFHRITTILGLFTGIFLFLAALTISEGIESIKSYRVTLIAIDSVVSIFLFIIPGVEVYVGSTALPGSEQFIGWDIIFFIFATLPLYMTLVFTIYYYYKIWSESPSSSLIRRSISSIIIGTVLLGLAHFLLVIPHILIPIISEMTTLVLIGNIGSIVALIATILIFYGYRIKISDEISEV